MRHTDPLKGYDEVASRDLTIIILFYD